MALDELVRQGMSLIGREFDHNPIYAMLAPVRHYIGGLLLRDAAEKAYKSLSKTDEPANVLTHPLAILAYSLAPDIDTYIGIAHRGPTHSFAFAAAVGLGTMAVAALAGKKHLGAYFLLPFAAVASHIAVDTLIEGGDPIQLFWPSTAKVQLYSDINVIGHSFTALGMAYMWMRYNVSEKISGIKEWVGAMFTKGA